MKEGYNEIYNLANECIGYFIFVKVQARKRFESEKAQREFEEHAEAIENILETIKMICLDYLIWKS